MEKPLLVTDFLDRARKYYGDMEAIVATTDESFTYDEFGDRVDRLSTVLQEHGIEKGDRVAVLDPNTHYHLETAYATMQLGGVHTPLNYRLTPDDFEYILNDAGVDAIYADYEYARKVEAVRDDIPTELFITNDADAVDGDVRDRLIEGADASDGDSTDDSISDAPAGVTHPARKGGRVTDIPAVAARLTLTDETLEIREADGDDPASFDLRFADIIYLRDGQQEINGTAVESLSIRHVRPPAAAATTEVSLWDDAAHDRLAGIVGDYYRTQREAVADAAGVPLRPSHSWNSSSGSTRLAARWTPPRCCRNPPPNSPRCSTRFGRLTCCGRAKPASSSPVAAISWSTRPWTTRRCERPRTALSTHTPVIDRDTT